jgi:N-methylhydantoinase B/oxoprolinase/acetone carboxylase alpha subunit
VSLLTERRVTAPWGLNQGGDGEIGENWMIRGAERTRLPGKTNIQLSPGDRIRIETPGGGGWGRPK